MRENDSPECTETAARAESSRAKGGLQVCEHGCPGTDVLIVRESATARRAR